MAIILICVIIFGQIIIMCIYIYCIFKSPGIDNIMIRRHRRRIQPSYLQSNRRRMLRGTVTVPISIIPNNINEPVIINVLPAVQSNSLVSTPSAVSVSNTALSNTALSTIIPIAPHVNPTIAIPI